MKQVKHLCDGGIAGIQTGPFGAQLHSEDYQDAGVPLILIRNIDEGFGIDTTRAPKITDDDAARLSLYATRPGDLIMARVGTMGRVGLVTNDEEGCIVSGQTIRLRPGPEKADPKFLAYILTAESTVEEVLLRAKGSTRDSLNTDLVGSIPVRDTPVTEQRAVALFLDRQTSRIDALIDAKECLLAKMEEAATLFEQAQVFGHGNGLAEEAPDGGIHSSYPTIRNRHLFRDIQDLSTTGDEELLTVSHKDGVRRRADKEVYMFLAESHVGYKRCQPGDLIINTMWAWMGAAGTSDYEGIVSPAYNVYRPSDKLLPEYVDTVIRTPAYVQWMACNSTGVWKSRLRLYPQYFVDLYFPAPTVEEQREIVNRINERRARDAALRQPILRSIELAKERRQALITHTVTGQHKIPMEAVHA